MCLLLCRQQQWNMDISSAMYATIYILLISPLPHNIQNTFFRYFVQNSDVRMTQFMQRHHEKTPKRSVCLQFTNTCSNILKNKSLRSPADVFPLCWLVSCYCRLTPWQLSLPRALTSQINACVKVRVCPGTLIDASPWRKPPPFSASHSSVPYM